MSATGKPSDKLETLKSLADEPEKQLSFALELLKSERKQEILARALEIIEKNVRPEAHASLLEAYERFEKGGQKTDPGAFLRTSILKALTGIARPQDIPLLEQAATTYVQMPSMHDAQAAHLRAAAVTTLNEVDESIAAFHCIRLLNDPITSRMSGEPALTAVKVLAAQGSLLPLYYYAVSEVEKIPDVLAECLRSLTNLPVLLLEQLVKKYQTLENEVVLIGLFDLIIGHREGEKCWDFLLYFQKNTGNLELYQYLLLTVFSRGKDELILKMLEKSSGEKNPQKAALFSEIVPLYRRNNPRIIAELARLKKPS
jgi:hypothetical protein